MAVDMVVAVAATKQSAHSLKSMAVRAIARLFFCAHCGEGVPGGGLVARVGRSGGAWCGDAPGDWRVGAAARGEGMGAWRGGAGRPGDWGSRRLRVGCGAAGGTQFAQSRRSEVYFILLKNLILSHAVTS